MKTYILGMLAKVAILVDQLRNLLLQPIVFLHQQLVHRCQLTIHRLKARGLFPLLLPASEELKTDKIHQHEQGQKQGSPEQKLDEQN